MFLNAEAYRSSDLDEREYSDSDDDEEQPKAKPSEGKPKIIAPKDNTWFSVFDQLTTFPSLISARIARLRQELEQQPPE